MVLVCVLVTCLSLVARAGGDPNQAAPAPAANGTVGVAKTPDMPASAPRSGPAESPVDTGKQRFPWTQAVPWAISFGLLLVAIAGFGFGLHQYRRRKADAAIRKAGELEAEADFRQAQGRQASQTAEDQYKSILENELGTVQVLGTHEIANIPVDLLETFVSLDIAPTSESGCAGQAGRPSLSEQSRRGLTPEAVVKQAFENQRMLLVLGDAGSGKTTLLKYYAMLCLKEARYRDLGFRVPLLPIYFPLRDIDFSNGVPGLLHDCLARWAKKHYKDIGPDVFLSWLNRRCTLVLLDGLDEISDLEKRRKVCEWIDDTAEGLGNAHLIVTSRWTGYRKLDLIQLGFSHAVAEIKEFSSEQQAQFLRKWFVAAYRKEPRDASVTAPQWEATQSQRGLDRAQAIIDFLALEKNKTVRGLVAVPMLLQIVAILWKEHENLPQGRAELYEAALKYLLDFRERHRHLRPPLKANQALRVLAPLSLWMQEALASDEVRKSHLHERMQPIIDTLDNQLTAQAYCEYLRDRAAVLADWGDDSYVFRHKSFREYLAGRELVNACKDPQHLSRVAKHLGDDWWEEPLRFFMGEVDDSLFDGFMDAVFRSDVSKELDQKTYNLLLTLVGEASQRRVSSLVKCLNDKRLHENKKRYIIDCLRTVGSEAAWTAMKEFADSHPGTVAGRFAKGLVAQEFAEPVLIRDHVATVDVFKTLPPSFLRPSEMNAAYVHISGGTFKSSADGEDHSVPDLYWAQYPVTNRRYRRFIDYLAGRQSKLNKILPFDVFTQELLEFARRDDALATYLTNDPQLWSQKLRSKCDEEKRFNSDDQPVVGVSWFDAQAYCFWLSSFETASRELTGDRLRRVYRLPSEIEWVWAAFGREPGGALRDYPWPTEKGKPSDKLANYNQNVGATTPVGRYPDGATPEGLMDMAGNVWEWMENRYGHKDYPEARSLRGGSWVSLVGYLGRSGRLSNVPGSRDYNVGFRVVCSQS